jgi:type IV pilus assembly protein PilE
MTRQPILRHRQGGFTLIELMMVIAIVGILAAIGYPSYINSTIKSNRAAAQSYLMDLAQAQQQFFNDSRTYAADEAALGISIPARVGASYTIGFTLVAGPPPTFTISATPKAGSRQVGDGILSIDNTGTKLRGSDPW